MSGWADRSYLLGPYKTILNKVRNLHRAYLRANFSVWVANLIQLQNSYGLETRLKDDKTASLPTQVYKAVIYNLCAWILFNMYFVNVYNFKDYYFYACEMLKKNKHVSKVYMFLISRGMIEKGKYKGFYLYIFKCLFITKSVIH